MELPAAKQGGETLISENRRKKRLASTGTALKKKENCGGGKKKEKREGGRHFGRRGSFRSQNEQLGRRTGRFWGGGSFCREKGPFPPLEKAGRQAATPPGNRKRGFEIRGRLSSPEERRAREEGIGNGQYHLGSGKSEGASPEEKKKKG